jgi:hypothetical protein
MVTTKGGNRDAYMNTGTVVLMYVGTNTMGAPGVTMVVKVVVRMTIDVTSTSTSPRVYSRGNIVSGAL